MNDLTIKSATPILKLKEPIGKLMIQFDDDQPEKLVDVAYLIKNTISNLEILTIIGMLHLKATILNGVLQKLE